MGEVTLNGSRWRIESYTQKGIWKMVNLEIGKEILKGLTDTRMESNMKRVKNYKQWRLKGFKVTSTVANERVTVYKSYSEGGGPIMPYYKG